MLKQQLSQQYSINLRQSVKTDRQCFVIEEFKSTDLTLQF